MEEEINKHTDKENQLIQKVKSNIKKEAVSSTASLIAIIEKETNNPKQTEQLALLRELDQLKKSQQGDKTFQKVNGDLSRWKWTNSEEGIDYLAKKIHNNQWLSSDKEKYQYQIDYLRKKYEEIDLSIKHELLKNTESLAKFIQENTSQFIDDFTEKLIQIQNPIEELREKYANSRFESWQESRRIVWGKPAKIADPINLDKTIDDFYYSGKTPEKTVYIPFSDIHKAIIDANWSFRNGENQDGNYLTAHLVFVTSNQPHQKETLKNEKEEEIKKYLGGRTFIDFPLVMPLELIEQQRIFEDQRVFEKFVDSKSNYEYGIGKNKKSEESGAHSEVALKEFLENKDNIKAIVTTLKNKLIAKFGESKNFKIYELVLFLNSQRNICDMGNRGCEKILSDLQSSKEEGSFLDLLKTELQFQGLKTLTKEGFPRIFTTDTSYMLYKSYCSGSLEQDAINGIYRDNEAYSIDIKELARKVILSTREEEIGEVGNKSIPQYKEADSMPFYSGFVSRAGERNSDLLNKKRERSDIYIKEPKSFDGVDIINLRNKPSPSIKIESAKNLLEEKNLLNER